MQPEFVTGQLEAGVPEAAGDGGIHVKPTEVQNKKKGILNFLIAFNENFLFLICIYSNSELQKYGLFFLLFFELKRIILFHHTVFNTLILLFIKYFAQ